MEDDLKDTWADIIPAKLPCTLCGGTKLLSDTRCPACVQSAPSMPLGQVTIGKRVYRTIALHNAETWINLLPNSNRWEIQGFYHASTGRQNRLFWIRQGVWMEEVQAMRSGREQDRTFEPDELEAQLELAIAGKTSDMK